MDKGIIIELDKLEYVGKATTMKIIIYGSQYGTAKQYAEELARKTSIDLKSYEDVTDINRYDTVIYVLRFCRGSKKRVNQYIDGRRNRYGVRIEIRFENARCSYC